MTTPPDQPTVRQLAVQFFRHHPDLRREVLELGRCDTSSMASTSGPMRPSVTLRTHGLDVDQHTPGSWASECAWHLYCRQHGYPCGELLGADQAPGSTYPPHPTHQTTSQRVTWKRITEWVRADDRGEHELGAPSSCATLDLDAELAKITPGPSLRARTPQRPAAAECPRCGHQLIGDAAVCGPCRQLEREPQGETMTLFNAPRALAPVQEGTLF